MKNIVINKKEFSQHLLDMKNQSKIEIFFDIETLQYNEKRGREKPTLYKNSIYSLAISYFFKDNLYIVIFPSFKPFFDVIFSTYKKWVTLPSINLIAHNNNKYDNHFLRHELIREYNINFKNQYLKQADGKGNLYSIKIGDLTKQEKKQGIILEKRVKSKNNLELIFFKNNIQFKTFDNWVKTNSSIRTLGEKLKKLDLITDEEIKTDYDYTRYHQENDMTEEQAKIYSLEVFKNLDKDELKYIKNDVIILAYSRLYYSKLFKGFSWDKITFTSNILDSYNTNNLASFQLLNKIGKGKNELAINYTDYKFSNQNLYDYLKDYYNGGLNFYNVKFLGRIIKEEVFGMDINSSYPYAMHKFKIPTYLNHGKEFSKPTNVNISLLENKKDTYTLYQITKTEFDDKIISQIKSKVIKQLLVKYYNKSETININSYTIKMIENITGLKITELKVFSYLNFDCIYFGSNDKLADYYRIKTQGQNSKKMNMENIYNITETEQENKNILTDEEINISKVNLNGLYGIPALRPYFNLFRWQGEQLNNVENGFSNSQRNILFSIFVTSVSLYNLLNPFSNLTDDEIDNNFLYCDTDSLYFKKKITHKIDKELFDPNDLGKWDIQNESIQKFYVLNHKKYAYLENGKITVKSGGVPNQAFNLDVSFEDFIKNQFSQGCIIKNTKGIYNKQGTISIYDSKTYLEKGLMYQNFSNNKKLDKQKEEIFEQARKELEETEEQGLYIESNIGSFSINDLYPVTHEVKNKLDISYLKLKENKIKQMI